MIKAKVSEKCFFDVPLLAELELMMRHVEIYYDKCNIIA